MDINDRTFTAHVDNVPSGLTLSNVYAASALRHDPSLTRNDRCGIAVRVFMTHADSTQTSVRYRLDDISDVYETVDGRPFVILSGPELHAVGMKPKRGNDGDGNHVTDVVYV